MNFRKVLQSNEPCRGGGGRTGARAGNPPMNFAGWGIGHGFGCARLDQNDAGGRLKSSRALWEAVDHAQ